MKDVVVVDINKDLQWLADARPLMNPPEGITAFIPGDHLKNPCLPASQWRTYPAPPAYRLGRQFEDCIEQLLQYSNNIQRQQRNLIINSASRTLGELDCLYENTNGECVHLELAIKFYLCNAPFNIASAGLSDFIGPGGKDRLDKKWLRLLQHQLPISCTPEALAAIHAAGFSAPAKHELLLTGLLFYPYQDWQTCLPAIKSLNPQHNRGWWLFQHQIDQLLKESDVSFLILPRWHWIGGLYHYESPTPLTHQELAEYVLKDTEPKMVAIIKWGLGAQHKRHPHWEELCRGFIVHNDWPAIHSDSTPHSNEKR